jgi:oligopeptide/dipeptide ABC transporter ATP-binding protein
MMRLISVQHLSKHFPTRSGLAGLGHRETAAGVKAVDDVSFEVESGETLAIVGESGSGKSTLGKMLLRLIPSTSGKILIEGRDIASLRGEELRSFRKTAQVIFQDPYSSLNPAMRVLDLVKEPLDIFKIGDSREGRERLAIALLRRVGLRPELYGKFPNQLSGGERQRVAVCRSLVLRPRFLIADEPTSALDAGTRAQLLRLLEEFKEEMGLTLLLITHDMAVARLVSDKIAVMYRGSIVEYGATESIFEDPQHPYTRLLLSSIPVPDPTIRLKVPSGYRDVSFESDTPGCKFAGRCPYAMDRCRTDIPQFESIGVPDEHSVSCFVRPWKQVEPQWARASESWSAE